MGFLAAISGFICFQVASLRQWNCKRTRSDTPSAQNDSLCIITKVLLGSIIIFFFRRFFIQAGFL